MPYFPKNAVKILKNKQLLRQYALKPYGFDAPTNYRFPKKHPQYKFMDMKIERKINYSQTQNNTLLFRTHESVSKPEIKQYLEKLYNTQVQKVNTARFMGVIKKQQNPRVRKAKITPNYKQAYVEFKQKIHQVFHDQKHL